MNALYAAMTAALCQDSLRKITQPSHAKLLTQESISQNIHLSSPLASLPYSYPCVASSALENGDRDRSLSLGGPGSTHNTPGTAPVQSPEVRSIENPAGVPVELPDGGTAYRPGEASEGSKPHWWGDRRRSSRLGTKYSSDDSAIHWSSSPQNTPTNKETPTQEQKGTPKIKAQGEETNVYGIGAWLPDADNHLVQAPIPEAIPLESHAPVPAHTIT